MPGTRRSVTDAAPWWDNVALIVREHLSDNASRLDGDAVGLLPGLVVGDTSGISDQLDADAKTTGITHLLAVSGSHFAILCGMVVVVLRRFGPRTAAIGGTRHPARAGDPGRPAAVGAARRADGRHRHARPATGRTRSVCPGAGDRGDHARADRSGTRGQRRVRAVGAGHRRPDPASRRPGRRRCSAAGFRRDGRTSWQSRSPRRWSRCR